MPASDSLPRIAVVGAGSVGCYLGGMLAEHADVTLVGRERIISDLLAHGLTVHPLGEPVRHTRPERVTATIDASGASGAQVVLLTTKGPGLERACREIAAHLRDDAVVVALQNGLNAARTASELLDRRVRTGLVTYNVAETAPGTFVQGTSGTLALEADPALSALLGVAHLAGLSITPTRHIAAVARGKLLLNLNNAVNALSDMPLRAELSDRGYRQVLAACQREALAVFSALGQPVAEVTGRGPSPRLQLAALGASTPVFLLAARRMLRIDPQARSSMADDLRLRRRTEIDQLQGEVVTLGQAAGVPTPVCAKIVSLVHEAERRIEAGEDWEPLSGKELRVAVLGR